ncbi:DNA replication complex GINS protein sld5 [Porphyridium purpureum]|uniref:DNA replication complex GINS protein SLD5 n=1 Tax=Porphyridium purpureum TaxID=35688 RepID=A0A5J4Z3G8_PORPP|nr:DNA replication complex GINS protein sld5 [Porphyridium purpureum]|eukprot:POR7599..scf208_2
MDEGSGAPRRSVLDDLLSGDQDFARVRQAEQRNRRRQGQNEIDVPQFHGRPGDFLDATRPNSGTYPYTNDNGHGVRAGADEKDAPYSSNYSLLTQDAVFQPDEACEDIASLYRALWNEQYAPELLPFATDVTHDMHELLEYQEQLLDDELHETDGAGQRDAEAVSFAQLSRLLRRTELERLRYVLRAYHRVRLRKIERTAPFLLSSAGAHTLATRLSEPERDFATSYLTLLEQHLTSSFLQLLPERLRALDDKDDTVAMIAPPHIDAYVFCRVLEPPPGGVLRLNNDAGGREEIQELRMSTNEIICMRYRSAAPLVLAKQLQLIF